jgi:copper homeostasis protein
MLADIRACKQLGAHGVVVGCLRPDGSVDTATTQELVEEARNLVRLRLDVQRSTYRV